MRHSDVRTTMNINTHAIPRAVREANRKVVRSIQTRRERFARRHRTLDQPAIGSPFIDNLNASIDLRALLTDLFLPAEIA